MTTTAVANKELHSDYWLINKFQPNPDPDTLADSLDQYTTRVFRLAGIRRAISNFVSILCGKSIPVKFAQKDKSYTDGKTIVIGADDSDEDFDVTVGLALHEAAHILLTDFAFLKAIGGVRVSIKSNTIPSVWTPQHVHLSSGEKDTFHYLDLFSPTIKKFLTTSVDTPNSITDEHQMAVVNTIDYLHTLMNILEDRRIDKFVYSTATGYRPYYDALYAKYFFTKDISENLKFNPGWREITVENYINRLLLCFHPDADPAALPGLKKLIKIFDLDTIDRVAEMPRVSVSRAYRSTDASFGVSEVAAWTVKPTFEYMPRLWKDANFILERILKLVCKANKDPFDRTFDEVDFDMSDEVIATIPAQLGKNGKPGKYNGKNGASALSNIGKFMKSLITKKKVSLKEANDIDAIDEAAAQIVSVEGNGIPKLKCIVTRKLTKSMLTQEWFPFTNKKECPVTTDAIKIGCRMGKIFLHRLQVRNSPLVTKQIRLPQGNLDRRMLYQLGMDIESVFYKTRVDNFKPALLFLTVDGSGSMHGTRWKNAAAVAVALAYVGSKMSNIDTVVTIRGGTNFPVVSVVFDSRKDNFQSFISTFSHLTSNGNTPEGICYAATLDLILETSGTHDVYFINFSDGVPVFSAPGVYYTGKIAVKHTAKMISIIKEHNVHVLSYFIKGPGAGLDEMEDFRKMYGEDAQFINVESTNEVIRTLNKALVVRTP
jgi:hypothetical protein